MGEGFDCVSSLATAIAAFCYYLCRLNSSSFRRNMIRSSVSVGKASGFMCGGMEAGMSGDLFSYVVLFNTEVLIPCT